MINRPPIGGVLISTICKKYSLGGAGRVLFCNVIICLYVRCYLVNDGSRHGKIASLRQRQYLSRPVFLIQTNIKNWGAALDINIRTLRQDIHPRYVAIIRAKSAGGTNIELFLCAISIIQKKNFFILLDLME